jgi:hypothetical protein
VIRLFNVYYPVRTLVLLAGEALVVWTSFLLGTVLRYQQDSYLVLNYEGGYLKILIVTAFVLAFSHLFDLYDPTKDKGEQFFRLLFMLGIVALALAMVGFVFPSFLLGNSCFLFGVVILTGR